MLGLWSSTVVAEEVGMVEMVEATRLVGEAGTL